MRNVTVILMAAGLSRRMGERNKLLLPINGVPMIRHMVDLYAGMSTQPVLVVTGHDAKAVEEALEGSNAKPVFNPDYAQGQQTSVACGLRAADGANPILIGLGDQPLLTRDDLNTLFAAHEAADQDRISIPILDNQRGNPILVPGHLRARLLADPKSPGCKTFTRAHPEHIQFHALPGPGFYTDIDTPEAYSALLQRTLEKTP